MLLPRVTVAIIAYYAQFLEECIASVLAQTYRDIEVIVYDDRSPENLESIVCKFDDPRLRYVRNEENLGTFGNTNNAIRLCETEYVNVFHGDDAMLPWMIETLVSALDANPGAAFASSKAKSLRPSKFRKLSSSVRKIAHISGELFKGNEFVEYFLKTGDYYDVACPSIMLRKKDFTRGDLLFSPEVGPAADLFFVLRANHAGLGFYLIYNQLMNCRSHATNWSKTAGDNGEWEKSYRLMDRHLISWGAEDMRRARWHWVRGVIAPCIQSGFSPCMIAKKREELRGFGWEIEDAEFDLLLQRCFKTSLKRVGSGEQRLSDHAVVDKELKELGFAIPSHTRWKWFFEYVVWQRLIGVCSRSE